MIGTNWKDASSQFEVSHRVEGQDGKNRLRGLEEAAT